MTRFQQVVDKYLNTYAEHEIGLIPEIANTYDHCLVVPAFDETWQSLQKVWQKLEDNFLLILVINAPRLNHRNTLDLLRKLKQNENAKGKVNDSNCAFIPAAKAKENLENTNSGNATNPDILLIDRCSDGLTIAPSQGVGLARKIGADIALQLITNAVIRSSRISITDADAILPFDYFSHTLKENESAITLPFRHQSDALAMRLYEIGILYYANGLDWAGSRYAYTSLGSAMAISSNHYAMVRGFPKRSAAEDFYLLNKLAKTGDVARIHCGAILLSARESDRVPVGTGPGLRKIKSLDAPLEEYLYYHPQIFVLLKELLVIFDSLWENPEAMLGASEWLQRYVKHQKLDQLIAEQHKKLQRPEVFNKFLADWFDGFKTLKFIHYLRDNFLPSVPLKGITAAPFTRHMTWDDLSSFSAQLSDQIYP